MKRAGFTLAETVVALALFSAAAVVFCQAALNGSMARRRPADDVPYPSPVHVVQQDVLRIRDRKILEAGGEVVLAPHVRKVPQDGGATLPERVVARWTATVLPTPLLDFHQITLTVSVTHAEGAVLEEERVFNVYRPGWYEPRAREMVLAEKQQEWERISQNQP